MQPATSHPDLHQDCLAKLNRALDLALKTAEAASAADNHKVVIQAVREVTRIVTVINKMTDPKAKFKPAPVSLVRNKGERDASLQAPAVTDRPPVRPQSSAGNDPMEIPVPDLEALFPPHQVAEMDELSQDLFKNISRNWSEFLALGEAAGLHLRPTNPEG